MAATTIEELQVLITAQNKEFKKALREIYSQLDDTTKKTSAMSKTSAAAFGVIAGAAQALVNKGINMITESIGNAARRVDTLNNSNRVFQNMGFSASDTKEAMDDLNKAINGLPTGLDDAVRGVQALASVSGDVKHAEKTFKALNNGILAFGGSAEMVNGAVLQLSQLPMDGPLDAQTWNSLRQNGLTPVFSAMAKESKMSISELKEAFGKGELTVQDFTNKLIELDEKGGGGMASLEKQARDATSGIQTGWANMQTAITRGVGKIMSAIGSSNISKTLAGIGQAFEQGLASVADGIEKVSGYIGQLGKMDPQKAAKSIGDALGKAVSKAIDGISVTAEQLRKWFSKIDWAQLGFDIGKQGINFAVGFIGGLAAADWGGAFNVLKENWLPIILGVLGFVFAPGKLVGPIMKGISKIPFGSLLNNFILMPLRNLGEPVRQAFSIVFSSGEGVVRGFLGRIGNVLSVIPQIIAAPFRLAMDWLANEVLKIPAFFNSSMNLMKTIITTSLNIVKSTFISIFNGIFTAIKTIFAPFVEFFKSMFSAVKTELDGVPGMFTGIFSRAWEGVKAIWSVAKAWFGSVRDAIHGVFSSIANWFGGVFRDAYNRVTGVFSGLHGFFSGVWSNIVGLFRNVGTSVGNAIGSTFKSVINGVLRGAVNIINGFINTINGAVGTINKIPGVNIGKIGKLSVPQLASGGIVRATPGGVLANIAEGGKDEAVVPLDKLEKMTGNQRIIVNIGGETIVDTVVKGINNRSFMGNVSVIDV